MFFGERSRGEKAGGDRCASKRRWGPVQCRGRMSDLSGNHSETDQSRDEKRQFLSLYIFEGNSHVDVDLYFDVVVVQRRRKRWNQARSDDFLEEFAVI